MLPSSLPSSLSSSLSSFLALSCSLVLIVACGGSTADPPGSGTPTGTAATSTASTSPPKTPPNPGTPAATPSMPPATPTATTTSMPTTPPAQPNGCNALVNVGSLVTAVQVAAEAPAATGGVVADGTYHLTDLTIFTGEGGQAGALPVQLKQTVSIHGTSADAVTEVNGKSQGQSTTFVTNGTSATTAGTCPMVEPPQTGEYSATPTSLILYLVNDQGKTTRYTYVP